MIEQPLDLNTRLLVQSYVWNWYWIMSKSHLIGKISLFENVSQKDLYLKTYHNKTILSLPFKLLSPVCHPEKPLRLWSWITRFYLMIEILLAIKYWKYVTTILPKKLTHTSSSFVAFIAKWPTTDVCTAAKVFADLLKHHEHHVVDK